MHPYSEFVVCVVGIYCSIQTFLNLGGRHSEIGFLERKLFIAEEEAKEKEREAEKVIKILRSQRSEKEEE